MRILLVEDDLLLQDGFKVLFPEHSISAVSKGFEAINLLKAIPFNIMFLDIRLQDEKTGLDVLRDAREIDPLLPIIMMSGHNDKETITKCLELGAVDYLVKGSINETAYQFAVHKASVWKRQLAERHPQINTAETNDASVFSQIKGESVSTRELRKNIKLLGQTDGPFLIQGETGTGKELVAGAIWKAKPGKNRPFVTVNCAQFQSSTIEGELFGFEKGSFTGATAQKIGLFEAAHGGDIFLDEIGELPIEFQAKLLRVLQERKIRRMGSVVERTSEFRLIAATNRDLGAEVKAGRFREDLFYRLDVHSFHLVPLRNKREEVPSLLEYYFKQQGFSGITFSKEVEASMRTETWRGNIRQLTAFVKFISPYLDRVNPRITLKEWARWIEKQESHKMDLPPVSEKDFISRKILSGNFNYDDYSSEMKQLSIATALEMSKNNKSEAARILGVSRQRLTIWISECSEAAV